MSRIIESAHAIVCISRSTERDVLSHWAHAAGKTHVIYNGVTLPPIRADPEAGFERGTLLVVGTVEPRKNYKTILRAFESLRARRPNDFPQLTVVGGLGWMSEDVATSLRRLESTGDCRWLTKADDFQLWREYARCRVFTYLPLLEGFGYPPFEAAAFGCPLVLSDRSSVGEIWNRTARCVDPTDVDAIYSAWTWALDLNDCERSTVAARQRVTLEQFSWEACCGRYSALWQSLASQAVR